MKTGEKEPNLRSFGGGGLMGRREKAYDGRLSAGRGSASSS